MKKKIDLIIFMTIIIVSLISGIVCIIFADNNDVIETKCYDNNGNEIKDLICYKQNDPLLIIGYLFLMVWLLSSIVGTFIYCYKYT